MATTAKTISLQAIKKKMQKQDSNLSHSFIKPPTYLTYMNKSQYRVKANTDGKAMFLMPYLCRLSSINIRIFHITWITFFICFFSWFSLTNLALWMDNDLNLTLKDKSLAISIQSLSTILFRIIFGDLCDKIGARYSYTILLCISCISLLLISFISYNNISYIIFSFFTGIIGASFVITQYHVTSFFSSKCVGIANALSAGWGNFGGGVTMIITPLICSLFINEFNISPNTAWRCTLLIPSFLLFIMIFIYNKYTIDTPKGNIRKENITKKILFTFNKFKWITIMKDQRVWILSLSYAICFGIEVTVLNYLVPYFVNQFQTNTKTAGLLTFTFSVLNLFARGFGGYLSDILYLKYGIQGRIYCLFIVLIFESIFLYLFAMSSFHFGYSILMMVFFSFYVQIAEGIVFAIVPSLPHKKYIGLCMGIIGAGGNLGPMVYSLLLFRNVPDIISYPMAWIICGISVFLLSFTTLFIKFTEHEIKNDAKNTKNDYWTSGGELAEGVIETDKENKKGLAFVIH